MIKTWQQRCEEHPDHDGIVTEAMIRERMQEEIDELRAAIEQAQEPLTDEEITQIAATPAAIPGSYVFSFARAIEAKLKEKNA